MHFFHCRYAMQAHTEYTGRSCALVFVVVAVVANIDFVLTL
jgi:hypothetical protein